MPSKPKLRLPTPAELKAWAIDNARGWRDAPPPKVGIKADYSNMRIVRFVRWLRGR